MSDADHEQATELAALDHARSVLATSRDGVLLLDDQRIPIRFVIANDDGRLIASTPVAALMSSSLTMFVPEESDDALQLLLSPEEIKESIDTDRWMAHHLGSGEEPEHVRWGAFWIDSAKHGPWVFDGEAMMSPNPAGPLEGAMVKRVNTDRVRLAAVAQERSEVEVADPVCVAVDGFGLLVRARFGVLRVGFDEEARTLDEVEDGLAALGFAPSG
jgi:hypothetical protein